MPPPGCLMAIWLALITFVRRFFNRSPTTVRNPRPPIPSVLATPPLFDLELGHLQTLTPISPSPSSYALPSTSLHTLHSRSPRTPTSPSSAVIVQPDRSAISPTTMSDGSLEVISLGDPPALLASPVKVADTSRLPSPWSPMGKVASPDVWMSVEGILMNATGPIPAQSESYDSSLAFRTLSLSPHSLYSSCPALDAFGISLFVGLDDHAKNDDSNRIRDDTPPTVPECQTPRKRRDTLPSVTSHTKTHSARATKCLSTPLTKLDNVSATSISSMAYELRMGLFADGRSISAFENIISLLDQASPELTRCDP